MKFDAVYYEQAIFDYPLGRQIRDEYGDLPWIPIESHNSIREMQEKPNDQFGHMKRNLIAGIRKTHKYVENHKVSDYLVPYTSSGCTAMCLYCYLVCNYNKCAYLRLFVNREQMLDRIIKKGKNRYYSPKLKREMIDKVLLEGWFSTKCLPRLWPLKLRVA